MKRIAVLYHSGAGSTKKAAEKIAAALRQHYNADLFSVVNLPGIDLEGYDGLVIGFPTIHTQPSERVLRFIDGMESLPEPKAAYIFTTCGWYSANTLRIFAKRCIGKNVIPILHRSFWGFPAADGTLLASFIKRFFEFPKNLDAKIESDVQAFRGRLESRNTALNMPGFKLYSILNAPNNAGRLITLPIYTHRQKCARCGRCISDCPAGALEKDSDGYPVFISKKCEKCYHCIHYCPNLALSLSKRKTPGRVLGDRE